MAKRATAADAAKGNGYDGEKLKAYVEKIEAYFAEMESSKGAHMKRCREIRDSIDVVYEEAKALGIPKKALRTHVKLRQLEAKKEQLVEKLADDELDDFEAIADALGDLAATPLGMAALQRRQPTLADRAALDSLN